MNAFPLVKVLLSGSLIQSTMKVQHLRRMSQLAVSATASPTDVQVKPQQINKYMKYLSTEATSHETKPLVVIYGWLMSKEKHYRRINDFYLRRGFDVLKLQISPRMMLWPITIKPVVSNMLDYLSGEGHNKKPLLLHGFSVGGYMYADTMYTILQNPEKYGPVAERMLGHVSDSPVDVMGTPSGVSKAVTNSKILQKLLEKSIYSYLDIFHKQCTSHMWTAHKMYHENPLGLPTLYLYSPKDMISTLAPIYKAMGRAKAQNIPYFSHEFPDTQHVEHFRHYPEIYKRKVEDFIDFVKIKNANVQFRKDVRERMAAFPL